MTTNSVERNSQGYGGQSFEPMTYNVDQIEPDAYPGAYTAENTGCKFKFSGSGKPMIVLEWKLVATDDESEESQKSIGGSVTDWVVLANDRGGNRGKLSLRAIKEQLGLDIDFSTMSEETIKELAAALKGQTMPVWISNRTDNDGNVRAQVHYTAPRTAGMAPMGGEEEAEEAPKPAAKKPAAKPQPAKKAAGRR